MPSWWRSNFTTLPSPIFWVQHLIDSTPIAVCHNKRIRRHKVFTGLAQRGKSSLGWFYGFKLHLMVNDQGEIIAFCLTPVNVDDRDPYPRWPKSCGASWSVTGATSIKSCLSSCGTNSCS